MRRIHLIEFHEQPWFPPSFRDQITDALQFGMNLVNAYGPIAPLLQSALDSERRQANGGQAKSGQSVIDLCSGGGGPWTGLWSDLSRQLEPESLSAESRNLRIWLTDQFPNIEAFERVRAGSENHITYYPGPVDAMSVPPQLKGFRTMFTSFHHFSAEEGRAILQNAVDAGEGIGIFEISRRAASTVFLTVALVSMLFVCMPWIRPFRWPRLFWTYVVPIVPLVLLFDGVVSCLRTYRPGELRELVRKLEGRGYRWEIGEQLSGKAPITYLIGYPPVRV